MYIQLDQNHSINAILRFDWRDTNNGAAPENFCIQKETHHMHKITVNFQFQVNSFHRHSEEGEK